MSEQVIVVDDADRPLGVADKLAAHRPPGQLHRAFSVFLFDDSGRVLLQRRADCKYHFAGLWSNACCGHPRPGEDTLAAARRRLAEELGCRARLTELYAFTYTAEHPESGLIEREIDHVCVGQHTGPVSPDPQEASAVRWISTPDLERELITSADAFTPWFKLTVKRVVATWSARRP